jgi:hypothetical protein
VAHNTIGIYLTDTLNSTFTGLLEVGNNSNDCIVIGGTNPGLDNNTCANNGSSDASLITGIQLTGDLDDGNTENSALLGVLDLPTGNDTLTHTWSGTPVTLDDAGCNALVDGSVYNGLSCETTFLRHAVEVQNDGLGNNNILCESGETCTYMPNIGSYQGHGNLESAGAFINGTLSGITLMQFDTNGF